MNAITITVNEHMRWGVSLRCPMSGDMNFHFELVNINDCRSFETFSVLHIKKFASEQSEQLTNNTRNCNIFYVLYPFRTLAFMTHHKCCLFISLLNLDPSFIHSSSLGRSYVAFPLFQLSVLGVTNFPNPLSSLCVP